MERECFKCKIIVFNLFINYGINKYYSWSPFFVLSHYCNMIKPFPLMTFGKDFFTLTCVWCYFTPFLDVSIDPSLLKNISIIVHFSSILLCYNPFKLKIVQTYWVSVIRHCITEGLVVCRRITKDLKPTVL